MRDEFLAHKKKMSDLMQKHKIATKKVKWTIEDPRFKLTFAGVHTPTKLRVLLAGEPIKKGDFFAYFCEKNLDLKNETL